ncbi:hypothetical protein KAW96_01565 [candidate division WOR-3 bacterium]|nr:hypothetical protein [candidate division WOR-3 bacterium]
MRVELYIRDLYAEYPLSVIKERGLSSSRVQLMQEPDWPRFWQGEYRTHYHSSADYISPAQKGDVSKNQRDKILQNMKCWRLREERFGALFFDPDTNAVLKGDQEALKFVAYLQKGLHFESIVNKMGLNKCQIEDFFESVWEAYNGRD